MAAVKRITERTHPVTFTGGAIAESGILSGVCICGLESANGRTYPREVLARAAAKYEGANVYLDHSEARNGRGVREWFGKIRNPRPRADGRLEGDLHYETNNSFAREFESRVKNFPDSLGMSHVVQAQTSLRAGREIVEEIETVESVDLVASPATASGILESRNSMNETTLRAIVEAYRASQPPERQSPARKLLLLAEDDPGMGAMLDTPVAEPTTDAEPEDALWNGFWDAITAIGNKYKAGELSAAEAGKEVTKYIKTHEKLINGGSKEKAPEESEPAEEARRASVGAIVEALDLLMPGLSADVRILAATPHAERQLVVERLRQLRAPETPQAAGRDRAGRTLPSGRPVKKVHWD